MEAIFTQHGFKYVDKKDRRLVEVVATASSAPTESRKWAVIRVVCANGHVYEIVATPRTSNCKLVARRKRDDSPKPRRSS